MSSIVLLPLNVLPLPQELIQINVDPRLRTKLLEDVYSQRKTFGIFYNHFMNINKLASEVELVGATLSDSPTGKDLWVRGRSILVMSKVYYSSSDPTDFKGEIFTEHPWTNLYIGQQIENDIEAFLKYCPKGLVNDLGNKKNLKVFDILRLMELSDSEKFYALNLRNEKDLYIYIVNSLRLKVSYHKQKSSIDDPWYLN